MVNVADFRPASSPGLASSSSIGNCRPAAQRSYIRSIISAQSCASVPPVPDWSVTTASPAVVLAVEERRFLQPLELTPQRGDRGGDLVVELAAELGQLAGIVVVGLQLAVALEPARDARVLGRDLRGAGLVVPETRGVQLFFERNEALCERIRVKGTHGPRRAGPRAPRAGRRAMRRTRSWRQATASRSGACRRRRPASRARSRATG